MENRDKELHKRYGDLLDKFLNPSAMERELREQCQEEGETRYGDLLQKGEAAYNKYFDNIMKVADAARESRLRKEEKDRQAVMRMKERMERKRQEEQKRIEKNSVLVEDIMAQKKEREEAEKERIRKEREEAESRQRYLDSMQALVNMHVETAEISSRAKKMIERNDKKRKAHEDKMKWFEK